MVSSFVLKSAGFLVRLGGRLLKNTQVVSGQGSITGRNAGEVNSKVNSAGDESWLQVTFLLLHFLLCYLNT